MTDEKKSKVKQTVGEGIHAQGNVTIKGIRQTVIKKANVLAVDSKRTIFIGIAFFGIIIGGTTWIIKSITPVQNNINSNNTTYNNQSIDNSKQFLINNPIPQLSEKSVDYNSQKKDVQQKIVQYQKEIEKNPSSAVAWTNLGEAKRRTGDFKNATEAYNKALQLNPTSIETKLGKVLIEKDKGNTNFYNKQIYDAWQNGNIDLAYYNLGIFLMEQNPPDLQGAELAFKKSLDFEDSISTRLKLADIFTKLKRPNEAVNEVKKAISIEDNKWGVTSKTHYIEAIRIMLNLEQFDDAENLLNTYFKLPTTVKDIYPGVRGVTTLDIFYDYQANFFEALIDYKKKQIDRAITKLESLSTDKTYNEYTSQPQHKYLLGCLLISKGMSLKQKDIINKGIIELKKASQLYRKEGKNDLTKYLDESIRLIQEGKVNEIDIIISYEF